MWKTWFRKIPWRRERLPTPVYWPGEFHGLYSPWGPKELDMTEWLSRHLKRHRTIKYLILFSQSKMLSMSMDIYSGIYENLWHSHTHFYTSLYCNKGFPVIGTSGEELACQCRRPQRCGFDPESGRSPERGHGNPLQYSWPGESHGQRSLAVDRKSVV